MFILFFLATTLPSLAVENETHTWFGLFGKKSLAPQYSLWQELQLRYTNEEGSMQQILTRFGVLRTLNSRHEVGAIMGYVQTGLSREYRPTLQHIYTAGGGEHNMLFRSRLEWRDLENNDQNSIRYRLQALYRNQFTADKALILWEEPFFNLIETNWNGNHSFERNRAFAGIRSDYEAHKIDVGYLNQYIPRQGRNVSEHTLVLYLYY